MLFEERGTSKKKRVANGVPAIRPADAASKRAVVSGGVVPRKGSRWVEARAEAAGSPAAAARIRRRAKKAKVFYGAVNLGRKNAKVKVTIHRANGSKVTRRTFTIAPGATLLEEFPKRARGRGHWVEYNVKGKGGAILVYEVEDNGFDPLFIPGKTLQ